MICEIICTTGPGNLFSAAAWLNSKNLGQYLVQMQEVNAYHTICILRVPGNKVEQVKEACK